MIYFFYTITSTQMAPTKIKLNSELQLIHKQNGKLKLIFIYLFKSLHKQDGKLKLNKIRMAFVENIHPKQRRHTRNSQDRSKAQEITKKEHKIETETNTHKKNNN